MGDVHNGSLRVPAERIGKNLRDILLPIAPTLDLLHINGDFFDTALGLSDENALATMETIGMIHELCNTFDITLRVMRGTFSHDRTQCEVFERMYRSYTGLTHNFKYVSQMGVEHLAHLGIRVAYFPDNLPVKSASEAIDVVVCKMEELGWDTVDYAFVHGFFRHTVPSNAPSPPVLFTPELLSFVTRYAIASHVHTFSIDGHCVNVGSFERLAHGEPEDKGMILLEDDGAIGTLHFLKNQNAIPFVTLQLSAMRTPDEVVAAVKSHLDAVNTSDVYYLRVEHDDRIIRQSVARFIQEHRSDYPYVKYEAKSLKHDDEPTARQDDAEPDDIATMIIPTPDTLSQVVFDYLAGIGSTLTRDDVGFYLASE